MPQVALIALDPHTGEVLALAGGRDYSASQLDHAVAKRPTGSVFKPFVYAAAINTALTGEPAKAYTQITKLDTSEMPTLFTVLSVGISLCLAILLALLFNKQLPGFLFLRTIVLVPMLVTPIAVGIIWRIMMMPEQGLLNFLLGLLGIAKQPWVGSQTSAFASVLLVDIWEWTPFLFIIILAGLRGLPSSPFEAAAIDGATSLRVFFSITLPMLKPVIIIATLLRIIDAARTYDTVFIITRGGPDFATDLASIYLQRVNFQFFDLGYGSALSWIMLIGILIVVLVFVKLSGFLGIVSEKEPA